MRHSLILAAAAAVAVPTTLTAQDAPPTGADADLECVVFTSIAFEQVPDGAGKMGMAAALAYFVGRYEAQRGTDEMDQAIIERFGTMTEEQFKAIQNRCVPRMEAMSQRLQAVGNSLIQGGKGK